MAKTWYNRRGKYNMYEGTCMAKKLSTVLPRSKEKTTETVDFSTYVQQMMKPPKTRLWLWFSSLLVLGVVVLGITSSLVWGWLNNIKITVGSNAPQGSVQTLQVQHTAAYA